MVMKMSDRETSDTEYIISRLKEALERQENEEGQVASTPTVTYCLRCDKIGVDEWVPAGCTDHPLVVSDGYEHGGIQTAITVLRCLQTDSSHGDEDE